MQADLFGDFRLVGGTALSLQLGHRESVDIDLFSDTPYGTIDFKQIDTFLDQQYPYVDDFRELIPGMGKSYLIGQDRRDAIKLDIYYTDNFITPPRIAESIRLASIQEILAMKIEVVQNVGRKKDFWDLHELLPTFRIGQMIELHKSRYPYSHDKPLILANLTNFARADEDFEPVCLRGKYWEFIKEDIVEAVGMFRQQNSL